MSGVETTSKGGLTGPERTRLVHILGRLGSDFDGERAAAGLLASRMLRELRLDWDAVIAPQAVAVVPPAAAPPPNVPAGRNLALCQRHLAHLDPWPCQFIESLCRLQRPLSPGQADKLAEIAAELRARGFA